MSVLGDNLKLCRGNAKLSLRQVGERINKSPSTVSLYEKGTIEPSINALIELCNIYNVTPNDVLGYSNMPASEWRDRINNTDILNFINEYLHLQVVSYENGLIAVYDENDNMMYCDVISMEKVYYQAYLICDRHLKDMQSAGKSIFINSLKAYSYNKALLTRDKNTQVKKVSEV